MKNILVTGAAGMLGAAVCDYFSSTKSYKVTATGRNENPLVSADRFVAGDLTDSNFISSLAEIEVDAVVHCAALTDLEKSESDRDSAYRINAEATENLAKIYPESIFVYISTDSVFDGKTGGYGETDVPNPPNYYASTKLAGEDAVRRTSDKHYILRTNMYGFHRPRRRALFEWGYYCLANGEIVHGFTDVFFNPLYTGQLARVVERFVAENPEYGIYNAAADEHMNKYEFLQRCAEKFGLPVERVIESNLPKNKSLAVRPHRTFLNNDKIKRHLPGIDLSFESGLDLLYRDFVAFNELKGVCGK